MKKIVFKMKNEFNNPITPCPNNIKKHEEVIIVGTWDCLGCKYRAKHPEMGNRIGDITKTKKYIYCNHK